MRSPLALLVLFLAVAAYGQTSEPQPTPTSTPQTSQIGYVRPDARTRRHTYFKSMFGLSALGTAIASAGWATGRNKPDEWGPHWEGFGKRLASNMGKRVISNTVLFSLDEAFKLDSHFYKSTKRDMGSRLRNGLISVFTARREDGSRVFGFPKIAGTYTASLIAVEAWYPNRHGWKDGLRNGTVSLGTTTLVNLLKEFISRK